MKADVGEGFIPERMFSTFTSARWPGSHRSVSSFVRTAARCYNEILALLMRKEKKMKMKKKKKKEKKRHAFTNCVVRCPYNLPSKVPVSCKVLISCLQYLSLCSFITYKQIFFGFVFALIVQVGLQILTDPSV